MTIGIILPLKSKSVAKNWNTTVSNLNRTLSSIANQTSKNYRCILVCHEMPTLTTIESLEVFDQPSFKPPSITSDKNLNQLAYEEDRCRKISIGIEILKKKYPTITHWFPLDADDLLHKKFIESLSDYKGYRAIIVKKGYIYHENIDIFNQENEFDKHCGSSSIIRDDTILDNNQEEEYTYKNIIFSNVSHVHMFEHCTKNGISASVPAQRLVAYVRGNGENISDENRPQGKLKGIKRIAKVYIKMCRSKNNLKINFSVL